MQHKEYVRSTFTHEQKGTFYFVGSTTEVMDLLSTLIIELSRAEEKLETKPRNEDSRCELRRVGDSFGTIEVAVSYEKES